MKIYLASSWRNPHHPAVVGDLRRAGHEVYDFRENGFSWKNITNRPIQTVDEYRLALRDSRAGEGFRRDFEAMNAADVGILLLPAGRSAHLELGYMAGCGKLTIVWTRDGEEPELMNLLANDICSTFEEVCHTLDIWGGSIRRISGK